MAVQDEDEEENQVRCLDDDTVRQQVTFEKAVVAKVTALFIHDCKTCLLHVIMNLERLEKPVLRTCPVFSLLSAIKARSRELVFACFRVSQLL